MQFEPMSVGRILDRTFAIYKNNFLRFITIVAIIYVPITLISAVSSALVAAGVPQESRDSSESATDGASPLSRFGLYDRRELGAEPTTFDSSAAIIGTLGTMVGSLLFMIGSLLAQAALTKSVSETYLGNEITVGQAYRFVLPKGVTLFGATILVSLVVGFGMLLFIVPGIIFGLWFFLTTPSIVVENRRIIAGMSRSKALVSGNLGKVFAIGFLVMLIAWIINIPITLLTTLAGILFFRDNAMLAAFVHQFVSVIGQVLVVPIGAAASILLYYDLRIRKEGFDLQMLAQSMASDRG